MEHPSTGTNHLSSPPYSQPYPPVQQGYGREQEYGAYSQKMAEPYFGSQRSGATTPIYPTPLPALVEPGQNYSQRGLEAGPKQLGSGGQQFGMTGPGYGQGGSSSEMGPMMRALTEDDVFMPQPPSEYRSPMQGVSPAYGQSMGYTSPDGSRAGTGAGYGAGQYPSPFSPGHSPRSSQIYPVRGHPMSPHDAGGGGSSTFGANPPPYHRQASQSPHMNMVSPTGQGSVFGRGAGVTAPSPVVMQGQGVYSHSPGVSQAGRGSVAAGSSVVVGGNTHFPFSTSPVSQHTSPLPSPSSLRSPGVVRSPHNLATASPGPFNTPSNPSPVNVPRPIKSPMATAFQSPAATSQSGHPLVSPKVRPVDNGDHNSSTPYVELVHTRNEAVSKSHAAGSRGSPDNPYPKKKEDRCSSSSGHLPKLEEMVAFLGESATKGILPASDSVNKLEENGDASSKSSTKDDGHSDPAKPNGEKPPTHGGIHLGSVEAPQRQTDFTNAKKKITVQENSRCSPANGSPLPRNRSPKQGSRDGSPMGYCRANGDMNERSPLPGQPCRPFDNHNGMVRDGPPVKLNNALEADGRGTQSPLQQQQHQQLPPSYKAAVCGTDKNMAGLKRKFAETQNDVLPYHNSATYNSFPRNGGQGHVTAYPLTYTPTNGNGGVGAGGGSKEIGQHHRPNSPRGSKSPARKAAGEFADGSPRKVLRTYGGKKKRTSVDKQGNAIVLPSPLLPLSMTDPPKPPKEEEGEKQPNPPQEQQPPLPPQEPPPPSASTTTTTIPNREEKPICSMQTSTSAQAPAATEMPVEPRSTTPPFHNPMTTPSSQRSTPEKPPSPALQRGPPGTPTSQPVSDDPSTPTPSKRRGRPPGSKNRPRPDGEPPKPRKKPVKKNNPDPLQDEAKDELKKFKHVKAPAKGRGGDSQGLPQSRPRGPILRVTGTRDNPITCKVVNNPDALAPTAPTTANKKHGAKQGKTAGSKASQSVSRAPLGPATKQSLTVNNPSGRWMCALCGKPANHDSLGDLYGPYYPPGYQIPIMHPQSTPEKTKSAVAAAASKKQQQQQQQRTNQKGKLKAKLSPTPTPPQKPARMPKPLAKGKSPRSAPTPGQRKYSEESDYLMFVDEATTSSGRISKTPKRMAFEIPSKAAPSRSVGGGSGSGGGGGNRRRKSGDQEEKGPNDPNEYWVHEDCVIWTQGVYIVGGTLYGLAESIKATQSVGCFECKNTGASLGCMSKGCKKTYHYVCALQAECQLQVDNYSMICPQHKDKVVKMKDLT